jgi:hypothetical protein
MTRKDYNAFAHELKHYYADDHAKTVAAKIIARVCKSDNPKFDADRFYTAIGIHALKLSETRGI